MGSSNLSLILHSRQGRSSSLGKSSPNLENFKFQNFGSNWKKVSMLLEMDFENKENIQIKTHPDMEFLSCSEIFCETLVESKPAKPAFIPQMYPKVLQVNAQVDPTLVEDNRVLLNLIRNESRYLPKYPDYFRCVQVEVKPHMRKKKSADSDDSDYEKPKKKRKSTPGAKNGYTAPVKLSAELADIVGGEEMPRHEVVKRMWAYIKENQLQDPKNKQMIKCDDKLSKVIPTKKFRGFGMTKFLKDHMNVE